MEWVSDHDKSGWVLREFVGRGKYEEQGREMWEEVKMGIFWLNETGK